ncbi:bifunctional 5,10-methylenetetrahydrofolate dehydrogenase/5,10-methenyltetrahydrofolate cyclohydrolase [Candidatus Peregrinibacteria bacterium]|nr:bifunctional 5,10-methylenetetrahydrofolate dehydrogenase/5,10-methenyltetrahydrofolate cyclohydrolase [Candidatus Peregrinibacteria bacterium]
MTAILLDGKKTSEKLLVEAAKKIKTFPKKLKLVVVMVGADPASRVYVRKKLEACQNVGIISEKVEYPESVSEKELLGKIRELNSDDSVTGMIVQLPLPKHISTPQVIREINPHKDVDGFHAYNLGKMFLSPEFEDLPPATPGGIILFLEEYNISVSGMNVVVIGKSNIVGKPIAIMLLNREATVTVCHRHTKNLAEHTKNADIVIVAAGKPNLLTADMIREGAIVIDVGTNHLENGKLVGDVDFENVAKKAKYITPVPGGVGPMTVAKLILNTIRAYERSTK